MKANMAQQQDLDLSCDETFMSSPPVSFYQLLEEEIVPSETSTVKHQEAVDESYVLPGNLRSQSVQEYSNPQLGMKHSIPSTVPNQRDVSSDTYVLPGSLVEPSGSCVAAEHVSAAPEAECLLPDRHSNLTPQQSNSQTVLPRRVSQAGSSAIRRTSHLIPEDAYVPADNVYIQPRNNEPVTAFQVTGSSGRKVLFVEPSDSYIPAEGIPPQLAHDTSEVCCLHSPAVTSQNCVPPENSSTRSQADSSKHLVAPVSSESVASVSIQDSYVPADTVHNQPPTDDSCAHQIPRKLLLSVPEDCRVGVPAENLHQEESLKGNSDSRHRLTNGMVNGLYFPPTSRANEYV
jgi:hypothetical protein